MFTASNFVIIFLENGKKKVQKNVSVASKLGMATGRGGDGFRYPIPIPA